ncbi:MAG TPA: hypothetical protein VLU46_09135 [Thermoanaerobaculia bacterium]|nr:hypothetical protein [Thermoanaerobaculia bacterium]
MRRTSRANAEELRAFVKDGLAPYKCPTRITFATELPKMAPASSSVTSFATSCGEMRNFSAAIC